MSPVLAALARLQAGTSDTPIHDQLVVQYAVRQLTVDLRPALEAFTRTMRTVTANVAEFARRVAEAQAPSAPEDVLEAIRRDQQTLDWQEAWRAERETMGGLPSRGHNHTWPPCGMDCPKWTPSDPRPPAR